MSHHVTLRFIECHKILKENGVIRTNSEFAEALDYFPQGISEILNGRRDVTIDLMSKAVNIFSINPVYLTTGKGPKFLNKHNPSGLQILSVVVDKNNNERIVHVPITAQAGYAEELADPSFLGELPQYTLPDYDFSQGTYRSFDVEGASMYPSLHNGDRVICQYVEPDYWTHAIKGNHVYVIVSEDGVVVKRVKNKIRIDRSLILCSDNSNYKPYKIPIDQVKEVWRVSYVLKKFDHFRGAASVNSQEATMENLRELMMEHYAGIMEAIREKEKTVNEFL